uniref:HNH endonuclease n=1 Tax=Marseillevirus LCMAC101 TaxID=2506602 RepID=A0A481YR78_9VIRU|nr:MAG: HNH endonuclease [Marseillevirus LCMAC101]
MPQDKYYHREYRKRKREEKVKDKEEELDEGVTLSKYPDYIIYNDGRIFSRLTLKELKPTKRDGYFYIRLMKVGKNGNRKRSSDGVHILVAKAYHPNPDKLPIVNHIDGKGYNNHKSNIEWVSHKRSIAHAYETGLIRPRCRSVLQFEKDGTFVRRYESIKEASEKVGCHFTTISQVCRGVKSKHTAKGYRWEFETPLEEIKDKEGEKWKRIKHHRRYKISTLGRVYSKKTKRYLRHTDKKDGYKRITIDETPYYVHRLVANAFLGSPPPDLEKPVVDHKDGKPLNNCLDNLQWVEFDENISFAHNRDNSYNHKRVYQYSLDGEKMGEYKHVADAAKKMEVAHSSILSACSRDRGVNSIKDCLWRYSDQPLITEELKEKKAKTRVLQYTLDGDFLKKYSSITQATEETGIIGASISQTCRGRAKTAGGYQWKYKNDEKPIVKMNKAGSEIAIIQYSLDDEEIKRWKSGTEAARELKLQGSHISQVCKGNRKTTGGYKWKYV